MTVQNVRAIGGIMTGRRIAFQDAKKTEYTLESARVVDGKLLLDGKLTGRGAVTSTLIGTTARAVNPNPRASDAEAPKRETERTEQTQSLYTESATASGCDIFILKMGNIQLGVALAHLDNQRGEAINHAICRVKRALDAGVDTKVAVESLNRLLTSPM